MNNAYKEKFLALIHAILNIPTIPDGIAALIEHQKAEIDELSRKIVILDAQLQEALDKAGIDLTEEENQEFLQATEQLTELAIDTANLSEVWKHYDIATVEAIIRVPNPPATEATEQLPVTDTADTE